LFVQTVHNTPFLSNVDVAVSAHLLTGGVFGSAHMPFFSCLWDILGLSAVADFMGVSLTVLGGVTALSVVAHAESIKLITPIR
jgi:hypothetical protein